MNGKSPHPSGDEGSTPIRPLHFSSCALKEVADFVRSHHYSHSIPVAVTDCFALDYNNRLAGAAIFSHGSGNPRGYWGLPSTLFRELTRFVLLDEVPRLSESRFLGWCLREMARRHRELIAAITFADPTQGHEGTIYKATNWQYLGLRKPHRGHGRGEYSAAGKHKFIYVFHGERGNG